MKKLMTILLALLLCVPAMAEEYPAIPVEIVNPVQGQMTQAEAMTKGQKLLRMKPEQQQTRVNLVRMSDDSYRWVVTVFDMTTLADGWCVELDASTGERLAYYTTDDGFFTKPLERWAAHKGGNADQRLWTMETKALLDALYALQPMYGLPQPGDMPQSEATERAFAALEPYLPDDRATGYLVCPGYLMGAEDVHGIWEVYFADKDVIYQVNLDAVTGEVYYISADDNGNG